MNPPKYIESVCPKRVVEYEAQDLLKLAHLEYYVQLLQ